MNRRGTIEWNLVNIGKLLIGVAFLLIIFFVTIALIGIFKDEGSVQAKKNFEMLITRINTVKDNKIQGAGASMLYVLPEEYSLIEFEKTRTTIDYYGSGKDVLTSTFQEPSSCNKDKACLCLTRLGTIIECENVNYDTVTTSTNENRGPVGSEFKKEEMARVLRGNKHDCGNSISTISIIDHGNSLVLGCLGNVSSSVISAGICIDKGNLCDGKPLNEPFVYTYTDQYKVDSEHYAMCLMDGTKCKFVPQQQVYCMKTYDSSGKEMAINYCYGKLPPIKISYKDSKNIMVQASCTSKQVNNKYTIENLKNGICQLNTIEAGATVEVTG